MSKIMYDGLTRSGTGGCFIAVPMWQQWASKGFKAESVTTLNYMLATVTK